MHKGLEANIAPDFTLTDTDNRTIRLSDYKGTKNVVLVFNRGFVWPYCRKHMAQLRQDYHEFVQRNTEVIAIGPEDRETFTEYWHKERMPFVGLPDHEHAVADLYKQEVNPAKLGRLPAQFVIDTRGRIQHGHYGSSMSDIPSNLEILTVLDGINETWSNENKDCFSHTYSAFLPSCYQTVYT